MPARKKVSGSTRIRVKVLIATNVGGEIVSKNTNYRTGGPFHPERMVTEDGEPIKDAPDPSYRDGDERSIGDIVILPLRVAFGQLKSGVVGLLDEDYESDMDVTSAFMEAVRKGGHPEPPAACVIPDPTPPPANQPPDDGGE